MALTASMVVKVESISVADFRQARNLMPVTVQKAVIEGVPMSSLMPVTSNLLGYIEFELIVLTSMVNVDQRLTLQKHQVPSVAQGLYDEFKTESIEDISVCFRRLAMGNYGEIYRLDEAVIAGAMRKYLEEKYQVIENSLMGEKENFYAPVKIEKGAERVNPNRNILAALETVIAGKDPGIDLSQYLKPHELQELEEARRKGAPVIDETNAQSNALERYKLERQPVSDEQKIEQIKKRNQRARELQEKAFRDSYPNATDEQVKKFIESVKQHEIPIPNQND